MKEETDENRNPDQLFDNEEEGDEKEELSILEFIERKKLQNKILAELIGKISNSDAIEKSDNQDDSQDL